jgi:L-ascorbate metabolism protein UlaG (beta-lactamase superfamily)
MKIKWLGHASFLITSKDDIKVVIDPYTVGKGLNYRPINESADIVTSSHVHGDHNNVGIVKGTPKILREPGSYAVKGIEIKTVSSFHDEAKGSQRGDNLIFCFRVDGMNLCHLGDLGHRLSQQQILEMGTVDALFVPVGGFFTVDANQATEIVKAVKPRITFPMHYKNLKVDYPIAGVDQFIKGKTNVRRLDSSEVEIKKETLPEKPEIVVLQPEY